MLRIILFLSGISFLISCGVHQPAPHKNSTHCLEQWQISKACPQTQLLVKIWSESAFSCNPNDLPEDQIKAKTVVRRLNRYYFQGTIQVNDSAVSENLNQLGFITKMDLKSQLLGLIPVDALKQMDALDGVSLICADAPIQTK